MYANSSAAVAISLDMFRSQSAEMFSAMKHALPANRKAGEMSLAAKLGYMQRLKESGRLQVGEDRRKILPFLVRLAGDQNASVSAFAFDILSASFPEDLESVTRAFESMVYSSLKPVELGVRFFVSRSPVANKELLMQRFLGDVWTRRSAINNLLNRGVLFASDLPAVPCDLVDVIVEHPMATTPLREAIIFCGVCPDASLLALKAELAAGGNRDHHRTMILAHKDRVPLPVLIYAIEEMGITKDEIFNLLGFKKPHVAAVEVDEAFAAELALAAAENGSAASAMLPSRPLKKKEAAFISQAIPNLVPVNPKLEWRGMLTGTEAKILASATRVLISQGMLDAEDLASLAHHRNNRVDYVLAQHPDTAPAQLLDIVKRGGAYAWTAYQRAESVVSAEELNAAARGSKNQDIAATVSA